MATFVLIHGAASDSWYWHLVAPELRARGHAVVTPDLPSDDDAAGFAEYADAVVDAVNGALGEKAGDAAGNAAGDAAGDAAGEEPGGSGDLVLVAQSLAGFTAPLVCGRLPVRLLVMLAAMIPTPGESGGEWWGNTGQEQAAREKAERDGRAVGAGFDPDETFLHDLPPDLAAETNRRVRDQSGTPFEKPWPLAAWPAVPTRVLLCRDDRLFPADFQRRLAKERLGITPDEMDGGHLPALARPKELAERLDAYGLGAGGGGGLDGRSPATTIPHS